MQWHRAAIIWLVGAAVATPAAAQAIGLPVTVAGVPTGVTLLVAGALNNENAGKGQAGLLGVSLGARRTGVTAFVARRFLPDGGPSFVSAGAALTSKVLGGPLVPLAVNLQIGAAYAAPPEQLVLFRRARMPDPPLPELAVAGGYVGGTHIWHVPVALGLSWVIPQPVVALKPWIAPRLDVTRVSVGGTADTSTEFGLSGGVTFGFLNGLGVDFSYDRVFAGGGAPASAGLGLSYTFR